MLGKHSSYQVSHNPSFNFFILEVLFSEVQWCISVYNFCIWEVETGRIKYKGSLGFMGKDPASNKQTSKHTHRKRDQKAETEIVTEAENMSGKELDVLCLWFKFRDKRLNG